MGLVTTRLGCQPLRTAEDGVLGSNAAGGVIKERHAKPIRLSCSERSRRAACSSVPARIGGDPTVMATCGGQDMPTDASCTTSTTRFGKDRRRWRRRRYISTTAVAPRPVLRGVCPPCGQPKQLAGNPAGGYGVLCLHVRSLCRRAVHCVAAAWNALEHVHQ